MFAPCSLRDVMCVGWSSGWDNNGCLEGGRGRRKRWVFLQGGFAISDESQHWDTCDLLPQEFHVGVAVPILGLASLGFHVT